MPHDLDALAAELNAARADLARFKRSKTYLRAQAFYQLTKHETLTQYPELDGAFKQLHDVKLNRPPQILQNDYATACGNIRAHLSEQLHRGQVPQGNITLNESRHVIETALYPTTGCMNSVTVQPPLCHIHVTTCPHIKMPAHPTA